MKKLTWLCASLTATALLFGSAQADTLAEIKASGKMSVGIDPTFAPYEYTNEKGDIIGYSAEIMQSFAQAQGVRIEYQKMPFSGIIPGLMAGSFNMEGSSLNVTAERAKRVLFTVPYGKTVNGILIRTNDAEKFDGPLTPESLSGMTGAAKIASVPEQLLKGFNETLAEKGLKPITIISVDSVDQTVTALMTRRADFLIDDISVLAPIEKKYPSRVQQVGEIGPSQWIAWATRLDDVALNQAISNHILAMQDSGELEKLQLEYLGTSFKVPADNFIPQE